MTRRKKNPARCRCGHRRKLTVPRFGPWRGIPNWWCCGGCSKRVRA